MPDTDAASNTQASNVTSTLFDDMASIPTSLPDASFMSIYPDFDQNMILHGFPPSDDAAGVAALNSFQPQAGPSTTLSYPSDAPPGAGLPSSLHLDLPSQPNSQPSSQHNFQHAFSLHHQQQQPQQSQDQQMGNSQPFHEQYLEQFSTSLSQPPPIQLHHQAQPQSQQAEDQQLLSNSQSFNEQFHHSLPNPSQPQQIYQLSQPQPQSQPQAEEQSQPLQYLQDPHARPDTASQLSFAAVAPGTFGAPAPGLFSGHSPTGSALSAAEMAAVVSQSADKRGRSSTISVTPELYLPAGYGGGMGGGGGGAGGGPGGFGGQHVSSAAVAALGMGLGGLNGDTRPRSSTGSAGSNVHHSFMSPVHAPGMSRTNSSVSLAVFQPLEQLNISGGGGRPGTGGSTNGSASSQHSGQFTFQRPASGGFPSVPAFGNVQSGGPGVYGHDGAVTAQQSHTGRFHQSESLINQPGVLGGPISGSETTLSPTVPGGSGGGGGWQGTPSRLGVNVLSGNIGPGLSGRKMGKLRRQTSNLTLDSNYSSNLSNTSFSPVSFGLTSGNVSESSPQFESFPSVPSSATSSTALHSAGAIPEYSQHFGMSMAQPFGGPNFASSEAGGMSLGFTGMSELGHMGSGGGGGLGGSSAAGSLSSKKPGSGYQTPTIMEEDESRMMFQNVVPMGLAPAQLTQTSTSSTVTPSMSSGEWSHSLSLDTALGPEFMQPSISPVGGPGVGHHQMFGPSVLQHQQSQPQLLSAQAQMQHHQHQHQQHSQQSFETSPVPAQNAHHAGPSSLPMIQRNGPSVIVRYGGQQQQQRQQMDGRGSSDSEDGGPSPLELQPSTLHHAVPITMASKYGPCGVPASMPSSAERWSPEFRAYMHDQICEYLATPSRLGLGERTVTIMTAKVGPKSYGTEKRFLCPPPLVMLSGSSWWSANPAKMLPAPPSATATEKEGVEGAANTSSGSLDTDESDKSHSRMAVLVPPSVTVKMLTEANVCDGSLQWASSDGRLIDGMEGLKNKLPIAGRCLARTLFISEGADDKRKPVFAQVAITMPGPEKPIELGTFSSGPIKVISKAFRKRQGVKNSDLSILHGSTVSLFHRLRSQTLSTRFLCVSGPPTWIKGSDSRPFLKTSVSSSQVPSNDPSASFIVKTASWDSFVIYAVDPTISTDEVSQQTPLNPRFPTPPASARPLRVDGESSIPILYNQPIVLQCMNTGVTSPIMTIRAVEGNKVAVGGLPVYSRGGGGQSGVVPEAPGEPVSHNHRISLELLDEKGDNAVEPWLEGDSSCTPGRSGQFLACLQDAVGLRLCGSRKWLPNPALVESNPPTTGVSITDADQPRSAAPVSAPGATTAQAAFIAAVAAAHTRTSLAQNRSPVSAGSTSYGPTGSSSSSSLAANTSANSNSASLEPPPETSDGGKVKRPRRVSSSAVVPKDRTASAGRGRRRGQSMSTVGLGLDPVEPHIKTSASSTNLRAAAGAGDGQSIAIGAGCRWMIDVAESDIWSIIGTEQAHHTFYVPPAIQNGYLPPAVDLGSGLSHLVRTPIPSQSISPLPVLSNWTFSTTAHLGGAGLEPGRETVELHGEFLSNQYFVFFGDWESEVLGATSWRLVCTPPPAWDESGVPRTELPITLVREDGIIIPCNLTLTLKPSI
ncbi:hypothetical protein V8E36_004107 [Tilletia maclaganii]